MKFNWGHGITVVLIAFIGFIAFLVRGTYQERVDLTSADYYAQEVDYEQERDYLINGLEVSTPTLTTSGDGMTITFEDEDWSHITVAFVRPDNADLDKAYTREKLENSQLQFPLLTQGVWNVEIQAERAGKTYRWEFTKRI